MKKIKVFFFISCLAILSGSLVPSSKIQLAPDISDKFQHLAAFIIAGSLGFRAYPDKRLSLFSMLTLFGILIEILQYFVPQRKPDLIDVCFDLSGLLIASAIIKGIETLHISPH